MKNVIVTLFFLLPSWGFSETCEQWFNNLKISTGNKNCISICNTSLTDMSTFSCPSECEKICKPKKKSLCETNKLKIQIGKIPNNWPWPKDQFLDLTEEEKALVATIVQKIDPSLIQSIDGIYFLNKPKDLFSVGTESSYYEKQIIIFKRAFNDPDSLSNKIVHELGHHLHETKESKNFQNYSKKFYTKKRDFLTSDSKFNAEEDFATNFEYYINDPETLKRRLPTISKWFEKMLGSKYNLKECK
jgi:hypothetical protein